MNIRLFKEARARIAPYIIETPLVQSLNFPDLYLKCENFQWTRSYKPRGAVNAALQQIKPGTGIVARSSGNFAQGIAYAGNRLGFQVNVVMPEYAPSLKVMGTKALGANVFLHGTTHAEGYEKANALVREGKGVMIHAFDDLDVIAGQGTVALEVFDQLKEPAHFFGPIGGGGIMAGCSCVIKQISNRTQVIGVEPEGAARLTASLEKGKRLELPSTKTIADGLLSPSVGKHNWPLLQQNIDSTVRVSEQEIIEAMKILFDVFGLVTEPSGAVSFAGYLKKRSLDGPAVCVITGGNVDRQRFIEWVSQSTSSAATEVILTTDRLLLRRLRESDLEVVAELLADPLVMEYSLNGPLSREAATEYLNERIIGHYRKWGFGPWGVFDKNNGTFIGMAGLLAQEIDGQSQVEVAYRILPRYWNKGYATEAAMGIRDWGFENLQLSHLDSIIEPSNLSSARVAEKIGMTKFKRTVFHGFDVDIYRVKKNLN